MLLCSTPHTLGRPQWMERTFLLRIDERPPDNLPSVSICHKNIQKCVFFVVPYWSIMEQNMTEQHVNIQIQIYKKTYCNMFLQTSKFRNSYRDIEQLNYKICFLWFYLLPGEVVTIQAQQLALDDEIPPSWPHIDALKLSVNGAERNTLVRSWDSEVHWKSLKYCKIGLQFCHFQSLTKAVS